MQDIRLAKLLGYAITPTRAYGLAAGFDLYAAESGIIEPGSRRTFVTGISMEIPEGYVGLIWPRSGLAVKKGLMVMAGVIDPDYRGDIVVCLFNSGRAIHEVNEGDKIAQILIQPAPNFTLLEVESLSESERGGKGFGSSDT